MKKVVLGQTGLEISRVGFGGIPIQRLTEREAVSVVQHCLDLGVTFLDTANGYTTSEERIGKAIAGRRDAVAIATKTGARDHDGAMAHLELSLQRLRTDAIDLWQFHGVSTIEAYEQVLGPGGAMEAAQEALGAGKVRHIGITSHAMDVALEAILSGHFETLQYPFNFIAREPAEQLVPLAQAQGVGFIAMKPFGGGLLDNAAVAIKYLLQFDGVVPDPGIEKAEEIDEIADLVAGEWTLTWAQAAEMTRLRQAVGSRFCRRCGYCMPCPQGIEIPTVLNIRSFWKRFPPERFFSPGLKGAIDAARGCVECGACEEQCPYHLPIREMLVEHVAFYDSLRA